MARRINKKPKKKKGPRIAAVNPRERSSRVEALLVDVSQHMLQNEYKQAAEICESLLSYLPKHSQQRGEVLYFYGSVLGALQKFQQAYDTFTEALSIDPKNADLWYNHGMTSLFTSRIGRSLRDYEKALALNTTPDLVNDIREGIRESQELVKEALKERGPDFTLDQLIEQEDTYQLGLSLMEQGKWEEAEAAFRRTAAMGDCMPQPWGNIAGCYLIQGRYDEAEAALKRALEIDPRYDLAKQNLARLPEIRKQGIDAFNVGFRDPFKEAGFKPAIKFIEE